MSEYAPGTVAMVTPPYPFENERYRAIRDERDGWMVHLIGFVDSRYITNITPLVCIDLTREDADAIERACAYWDKPGLCTEPEHAVIRRIVAAIREQVPEPEPPKRWTVGKELAGGRHWIIDNGMATDIRCPDLARAQQVADALNAAEPTP